MKAHLSKSSEIKKILSLIKSGHKNIIAESLSDCFRGILYSKIISETEKDIFIITSSENIYSLYAEISGLKDEFEINAEILFYPEDDSLMYGSLQASKEISKARAKAYEEIFRKDRKVIITDINALAEKIPSPDKVKKFFFTLKKDGKLKPEKIVEILAVNKYERVLKVENVFEYSVRGSIIDIFSPDYEYPVRIELFGDNIESLRFFSLDTYSTTKHLDSVELLLFNPGNKFKGETGSIIDYFAPYKTMVIIDDADVIKAEIIDKIKKINATAYNQNASFKSFVFL